ncbi:hypothetical protein [Gillisia sp. Hel_I_29]|uniref:hypothetical protein n=1 Tax=Gillisia sp. Hel_I_29 TaxID=1249975 RepID=UPI000AE65155|nr:hypothetical protein [Gillisia sp. Hel_I_29]
MKKFLKYLLSILVIIILSLYLLDFIYTYTYHHGTARNKLSYIMQRENDTVDYVFIGSSRVDNTINADIITSITSKSTINLGFQGAKIDDYYIILQLLKEQNIKFKKVFIQVDYVFNMDGNSEILKSYLMPYIHKDFITKLIKKRDKEFYQLKYIPFYRYLIYDYKLGFREFFNSAINHRSATDFKNGYFPKYGSTNQKLSSTLPDHVISRNNYINKINAFAKKNDITIIYFMAPYCPNTKNLNYSKKLKNKLPSFLDYSHVFPFQEDYFYNCSHLNDRGATEFSKIFAKDILRLEHKSL